MESDEKFVSRIVTQLYSRFAADGVDGLSRPEQVALMTWWTLSEVGDGGFRHFYEGPLRVREVADAFEELGFMEAAEACCQSSAFFPPEVVANRSERSWMEHLWEETEDEDGLLDRVSDFFRPFNEVISDLESADSEKRLSVRLAAYIRAHAAAFGDALTTFPKVRRWPRRGAAMS